MTNEIKADVKLYTTPWCPYCVRAKSFLKSKSIPFEDFNVAFNSKLRDQVVQETGHRTVPIITINGSLVGGCDDLLALEASGKLDTLLSQAPKQEA